MSFKFNSRYKKMSIEATARRRKQPNGQIIFIGEPAVYFHLGGGGGGILKIIFEKENKWGKGTRGEEKKNKKKDNGG